MSTPDAVGAAEERHRPRPVVTGTTSIMKPCRAMRNSVQHTPLSSTPIARPSDGVGQRREGHRAGVDEAGADQRPTLADPCDQRARGQARDGAARPR